VASTRAGLVALAVLVLALVIESVWVVDKVQAARAITSWAETLQDDGVLPEAYPRQAVAAPDFRLIDQHGRVISLGSLGGKPVVVAFVFAHCQTMCPLIVSTLKRAAPSDVPVEVLMVTLDPWRDTPGALPGIARQWELPAHFHVLSSRDVSEVLGVATAYRVTSERNEKTGDIVHPGLVFLVDPRGQLVYTFNDPPPAWVRQGLDRLGPTHAALR